MLFISKSQIPSDSANSINVIKMSEAFSSLGHSVSFVAPNQLDNSSLNVENVFDYYGVKTKFDIHKLPKITKQSKGGKYVKDILAEYAEQIQPDIIYARCNSIQFSLHEMKLPVVLEIHKVLTEEHELLNILIQSGFLKRIVVINQYLRSYYKDRYKLSDDIVVVAHSGADKIGSESTDSIKGSGFKVGYAGHLYKGKGMEIISVLAHRCTWSQYHIMGGSNVDLEHWKKELNHLGNIVFHGYLPHSKVYRYLNTCDVLLAPYQYEIGSAGGGTLSSDWVSPLKIFEYMSAGKAIIATSLPSIKEILRNGENAMLCRPDDVDEWMTALKYLYENPMKRVEMGKKAEQDFIDNYSWNARARLVLNDLQI